ncbi:mannan endo-1,4-beta-mannosidase 2-like protein [Tanacetum coccineum]
MFSIDLSPLRLGWRGFKLSSLCGKVMVSGVQFGSFGSVVIGRQSHLWEFFENCMAFFFFCFVTVLKTVYVACRDSRVEPIKQDEEKEPKQERGGRDMAAATFLCICSGIRGVRLSLLKHSSERYKNEINLSFVERNGTDFVVDGKLFYVNGWNSYWFMDHAIHDHTRPRIRAMLQAVAKMGLTVCRT